MSEISFAEEERLTFETRCEGALVSLNRLWDRLQDVSSRNLQIRQKLTEKNEAVLATLGESDRKEGAEFFKVLHRIRVEVEGSLYEATWERGVQLTHRAYGSDATDAALQKFRAGHPVN